MSDINEKTKRFFENSDMHSQKAETVKELSSSDYYKQYIDHPGLLQLEAAAVVNRSKLNQRRYQDSCKHLRWRDLQL